MSKWVVDIHGDIEGDYEIVKKYEEPKTGHWIDMDEGFSPCECSECKSVYFIKSKYCPSCGCLMDRNDFNAYIKAESEDKE